MPGKQLAGYGCSFSAMVCGAVKAYLYFHKENNFSNENIENIEVQYEKLKSYVGDLDGLYGGYMKLYSADFDFSLSDVEKLFSSRHSVREFSGEPISDEAIFHAVEMAQFCPSACNRQCTRVYCVGRDKFLNDIGSDLNGIGGFADAADRFLLITAKQMAYGLGEKNRFIVSASIFAGYLALSLYANNIAACTVQRPLTKNLQWDAFKAANNIADDEQIVVMFAIGRYKESTKVPVSKRFPTEKILHFLN